jgi:hypothetical protein
MKLSPTYRMMALRQLHYSQRPFQSRGEWLRGLRENLSFTLLGYTSFRVKRWLKRRLIHDQYTQ